MLTTTRSHPIHQHPADSKLLHLPGKIKGKRERYPEDRRRPAQHTKNHTGDDIESPVRNLPSMQAGPYKRTPTRVYRLRPESEEEWRRGRAKWIRITKGGAGLSSTTGTPANEDPVHLPLESGCTSCRQIQ